MNKKSRPEPRKPSHYKIYNPSRESSLGFWLLPLLIILIEGIIYTVLVWQTQRLGSDSILENTPISEEKDIIEESQDLFGDRNHAGQALDLNETSWGKSDPFSE